MSSSSEIVPDVIRDPVSFSSFFRDRVQRIMQDNVDFVVTESWGSINAESLAVIDQFPIPGELIRYHYAYELTDTSTGIHTLGVILDRPRLPLRTKFTHPHPDQDVFKPWAQRRGSRRHYFDTNQGLGILASHYTVSGQGQLTPLEGSIEDPTVIQDPLDDIRAKTLKLDLEALSKGTPVKPLTSLFRTALAV